MEEMNRDWSRRARRQGSPWTWPLIVLGVLLAVVVVGTTLALIYG